MSSINVTKVFQFSGHQNSIYTLHPSANKGCLYSGAADGMVAEWNSTEPGDGQLVAQVGKPVYSLLLLNDYNQLLIGTATGNLHLIDLEAKKEIRNIEAHSGGIFSIIRVNDRLYTGGEDGTIKQWDLPTLNQLQRISLGNKSTRVLLYHPPTHCLFTGSSDFKIRRISLPEVQLTEELDAHLQSVFTLCLSPDGNQLLSGGRDAYLNTWKIEDKLVPVEHIPAHTLHIKQIVLSPDQKWFGTASMDKSVKIWDSKTLELLKVIDYAKFGGHLSSVNSLLWLSNDRLVSCSDDRTIILWDLEFTD